MFNVVHELFVNILKSHCLLLGQSKLAFNSVLFRGNAERGAASLKGLKANAQPAGWKDSKQYGAR